MLLFARRLIPLALLPLILSTPLSGQQLNPAEDHPFLGLKTEPKSAGDPKSGLVVTYIYPASAAKEIGFQPGDEIRTLNDLLIFDQGTFINELRKENVNAKIRLVISRGGQEVKLQGRIGSYQKTMSAYQEILRKEMAGKPLPPLPGAVWWNPQTKGWDEKPNEAGSLQGRLSVVFSFDDCASCKKKKLERISQMKSVLDSAGDKVPVGFAGFFYGFNQTKEKNLKAATDLLTASPPVIPIAVAYYPGDKPPRDSQEKQFLIENHGVAILDTKGNIKYLQILGEPEQEFWQVYQKGLEELRGAKEKPSSP